MRPTRPPMPIRMLTHPALILTGALLAGAFEIVALWRSRRLHRRICG
ncbi:hypothetical protein [Sphaerotilus uruguayifluvii]|uniref:Uncharacterized protein n=1 Tax=Sphaerotilus uruguayifluvii TaxID=2735897 RepID=A0ABX2FZ67_9BURK|nr:hypothetical protein [Leptothrix sp. C29]NRT54367.1 hypothetical protein [Leptothrix sp. C29]